MRRRHEPPFGAELLPDGVRFRLWAPRANAVSVQLESARPDAIPMVREPRGWFSLSITSVGPGARYCYLVAGQALPDPASRRQPKGVHGPSEVFDPTAYDWNDVEWRGRAWEEIVLYELHLGTFSE